MMKNIFGIKHKVKGMISGEFVLRPFRALVDMVFLKHRATPCADILRPFRAEEKVGLIKCIACADILRPFRALIDMVFLKHRVTPCAGILRPFRAEEKVGLIKRMACADILRPFSTEEMSYSEHPNFQFPFQYTLELLKKMNQIKVIIRIFIALQGRNISAQGISPVFQTKISLKSPEGA